MASNKYHRLELRSLPSTGIIRLQRYYDPLRHPKAPGLSLTGLRLVVADRALGLPVFRALSLCTCCRHYPGAASGRITSLISSRCSSLPRKGCRVGLRIVLFEACSAFTRVAACTLALPPIRDTLIEGFSHFVTSMTAPIASGWSGCRGGLAPTGKRRLCTAHTRSGHPGGNDLASETRDVCRSSVSRKSFSLKIPKPTEPFTPARICIGPDSARSGSLSRDPREEELR